MADRDAEFDYRVLLVCRAWLVKLQYNISVYWSAKLIIDGQCRLVITTIKIGTILPM